MTAVTPPPATPPALPPAGVAASVTASVAAPPEAILALPIGARLEAVVQAADPALEKLLARTALGPVALQLPAPLPIPADARLVLQLAALTPVVQLLILSVDGAPPPAVRPGGPKSAAPNPIPPAPGPTDRINVGTVMQATFLRATPQPERPPAPATAGKAPGAGLPSAVHPASSKGTGASTPPGPAPQTLAMTVVDRLSTALPGKIPAAIASWLASARAETPATATDTSKNPGRAPSASAAPASGPAGSGTGSGSPSAGILPPGTAFAVRVSALHGQAGAPPAGPGGTSLAQGQTVLATVISSAPGHTLVETGAGTLVLKTSEALPKDLRLALEIAGPPRLPDADAARLSPLDGRGWPALEEAVLNLHREAPDLHQLLIANLLPKPDSTLAAGLVMFLAALRTGDIRAWLGEDVARALGRGQSDLLRRLEDDFRELARVADDPGSDWRVAVLPFNAQASIEQIRLLTRRPPREDKEPDADRTRFVIDVTLSRLGRIQLDGLVRRKDKRLDLMVRTATPLPAAMRDEIRRLFTQAGEATGINGLLAFEARENGFIEIKIDGLSRGDGGVIA